MGNLGLSGPLDHQAGGSGLTAVVSDLALRASAQRGAPALLAAQEAGEQVDPLDESFLGAGLLIFAELFLRGRVLLGGKGVGSRRAGDLR